MKIVIVYRELVTKVSRQPHNPNWIISCCAEREAIAAITFQFRKAGKN